MIFLEVVTLLCFFIIGFENVILSFRSYPYHFAHIYISLYVF